jgi:hypothetical protein
MISFHRRTQDSIILIQSRCQLVKHAMFGRNVASTLSAIDVHTASEWTRSACLGHVEHGITNFLVFYVMELIQYNYCGLLI